MRANRLILVGVFSLLGISAIAQSPALVWAKKTGGPGSDGGSYIAVDGSGNVFTTGVFYGTADFDPGPGVSNLTATVGVGWPDIFVSKSDASGNFIWAVQLGGPSNEGPKAIVVDGSGNVLITGHFNGTADFDPGAGVFNLSSPVGTDAFITKLDTDGNFVWAKRIGGASNDIANSMAVDATNNVYTTGSFIGTVDFDPGAAVSNLSSAGGQDVFVSKLDFDGNFVWAKKMGGTSVDFATSISIDGLGNVVTAGNFAGTADFDPGAGTQTFTSAASFDNFVSKLDGSGAFVWAKQLAGNQDGNPLSMKVDASNNIIIAGYFAGTLDFDPGAATFNLTSEGDDDIFVSKLDAAGNFVWADRMGGSSYDQGNNVAVDALGNVYVIGYFIATVDFDPGASTFNLTSAGSNEIFISKLDASGNFVWAEHLGGPDYDIGNGIALDASGNIYTTGAFVNTANFGPGTCVFDLTTTSANQSDIFIQKLSPTPVPVHTITGFGPPTGPAGTAVTITGTNFSPTPENNNVSFEGVPAVVTASTATTITATVPNGTITGPITVSIACNTVTSSASFIPTGPCYLPQSERNALIDHYNSTNGAGWINSTNWMSVDESTWYGITVSGCRVSEIDLNSNQLSGTLPASLTNLSSLQILNLGTNNLNGPLPVTIGALGSLHELDLRENSFNGTIPASLAICEALETLQLKSNSLTGPVPVFLGSLSNLKVIDLESNGLSGTIPPELGDLSALTYLSLAGNSLNGAIPPELGALNSLTTLDFSFNQLSGAIPVEIGDLNLLTSLRLASNQFFSPIPVELGSLNNLQILDLSQNHLNGVVPASLGNLSLLKNLFLNNNELEAALPASIGSLTSLIIVNLTQNHFTSIPALGGYDLHVENNNLDFGSLEPNMGAVNFSYDPQAKLPPGGTISFTAGGTLTIPFSTPGTANTYQWYKGVDPIPGATSPSLTKPGMTVNDVGLYYVQVTSAIVDGLILSSEPYLAVTDPCTATTRTAGDLDTTFDPLIDAPTSVKAIATQSTGKVVVATGPADVNGVSVDGIVRFNPDGSLDNSFASNTYDPGPNLLLVQADDKILTTYSDVYIGISHILKRLNEDGSDDPDFYAEPHTEHIFGIGLQDDGKILLSYDEGGNPPALVRLNDDGSLDPSFSAPQDLPATTIRVQTDGFILLGGDFNGGIVRLDASGAIDPAFSAYADGEVMDIAIYGDGKIIVVGKFNYFNDTPSRGIARLDSDGSLDNTFNGIGISDASFLGYHPTRIAIQGNGKIIVAGIFETINGTSRNGLVRLNPNGTVDCLLDPEVGPNDVINSMVLQSDEKILISGEFTTYESTTRNGFARVNNGVGATINITLQPSDATVCAGSVATFATAATGTTNITYQWQYAAVSAGPYNDLANNVNYSGVTTTTLTVNTAGNFGAGQYRCKINGDAAATVYTLNKELILNTPPLAPTTTGASSCSAASLSLGAAGGDDGLYRWYTVLTGGTALPGEVNGTYNTPVLSVTTTYYVSIFNGSCESVRTGAVATISILSKPAVVTSNCTATSATLTGPAGFNTYTWSDGELTQQIVVAVAGSYTLVVTDVNGCTSPASDATVFTAAFCNQSPLVDAAVIETAVEGIVDVDLIPLISDADSNIDLTTLQITAQPISGAKASISSSYRLAVDYSGISFTGTDRLTIQVCDFSLACTQTEFVIEVAGDITVYNGLSPNGDGKNDVFYIKYIDLLPNTKDNNVMIFNRWGDLVFEARNYDNVNRVFRGVSKGGDELPPGTYFYRIEFANGSPKTGSIALRR